MSDRRLVRVYSSANHLEVYLLRSVLVHEGIASEVRNEMPHQAGMFGATPDAWPELWVRVEDEAAVREVLARLEPREEEGRLTLAWEGGELSMADQPEHTPETCAACGAEWEPGFEVCWSCEAEL